MKPPEQAPPPPEWLSIRSRSQELRAESAALAVRCRRAGVKALAMQRRAERRSGADDDQFQPVAVTELFTIWVDHHGLSVADAVQALAVQLALHGYSEEADFVSAVDAIGMTDLVRR